MPIDKQCTTVLAQRYEAIRLYEKQQREREEKNALVEKKFKECIDDVGVINCNREDIEAEIDKERATSVADMSEDESPPSEEYSPQEETVSSPSTTKPEDKTRDSEIHKTVCIKCGNVVYYRAKSSGTIAKCMQCDISFVLP